MHLLVALLPVAGGCAANSLADPADVSFSTTRAWIEGRDVELTVELACTFEQWSVGLSGRDELEADTGMLFLFDDARGPEEGFWMWRTPFPLDIAFLDERGTILRVSSMAPCLAEEGVDCPRYEARVEHHGALEVPAGWIADQGIAEGDRLRVEEGCS
jgi:uncharacterized protein